MKTPSLDKVVISCAEEREELRSALAEAVRLLDALLGLEKGSGEAALAFIEAHASPVGKAL